MRIVLFWLCFIALPAFADQLIIEPEMGREPIINLMRSANHSISIIMYGWTDQSLLDSFLKQKVTKKIILEQNPYKANDENQQTIAALIQHHVPWLGHIPPLRLIHQKTLLIDGQKAMIMTFNFTHASFKKERNFALIIDDARRVKAINAIFSADWNRIPTHSQVTDIILSPDNSRQKLLTLISQAKQTIQIYAQNVSDYQIVGALAKAARKGINISILTSATMRDKQAQYLTRAGVHIRYSKMYWIHAKVMMLDHQAAVIGSINLTRASLDNNRELSVITYDPAVLQPLQATYAADWDAAANHSEKWQPHSPFNHDQQTFLQILRLLKKSLHMIKLLD